MKKRNPPSLACWLYRRLSGGAYQDALLGDLFEEFSAGRSRLWFWEQVTRAVIVNVLTSAASLGVRFWIACVTGVVAIRVWRACWQDSLSNIALSMRFYLSSLFPVAVQSTSLVVLQSLTRGFVFAVYMAVAMLSIRIDRKHRFCIVAVLIFFGVMWSEFPWLYTTSLNALTNPRYMPSVENQLLTLFLHSLALVAGGIFVGGRLQGHHRAAG